MSRKAVVLLMTIGSLLLAPVAAAAESNTQEFSAAGGGTLVLDFDTGATVSIYGTGGSSISVSYTKKCRPECEIEFDESGNGLTISTRFVGRGNSQSSNMNFEIEVPRYYDVELDSMGGALKIEGLDGTFTGRTMGGALALHDVRGVAELTTMGGEISLTDSELDGYLKTMGGEVRFENVIGDVKGSSMGGDVRYKNVQRRDGGLGSPARTGSGLNDLNADTVQISTMGGGIDVEDAPEGADVHTMGGNVKIRDARNFVRAKTMGGDIRIDSIDGWVQAVTMGGDIDVTVTGAGGEVTLSSNSGDVTLTVPSGFGMALDLEVAFTRNSRKEYRIDAPGGYGSTVTPDWDYEHGTPRKYIRTAGNVNGGTNVVKVTTINGNITVREE